MALLPFLHNFLLQRVRGSALWDSMTDICESFLCLCERVYCLHMMNFTGQAQYSMLLRAKQRKHMQRFVKAHSRDWVKPKHHYSLHIPEQFDRLKTLLDTKVCERKHQSLKHEIESSGQSLQSFEERMLHQICCVQVREICAHGSDFFSLALKEPEQIGMNQWIAKSLQAFANVWKVDECIVSVSLQWSGRILRFEQQHNDIFIVFEEFRSTSSTGLGFASWRATGMQSKIAWRDRLCYRPKYWKFNAATLETFW